MLKAFIQAQPSPLTNMQKPAHLMYQTPVHIVNIRFQ